MSMKPIVASAFLAVVLFASCKKELESQESSSTPVVEAGIPEIQNVNQQLEAQKQDLNSQTAQVPNQVQTQVVPTAPGMNPPHGQPNHRCDIADGAPLNSPKAAMPTSQPAPVPQGQTSITPAVATKPGMNPPHGQAGHLCEITVGAPLPK